MYGFMIYKSWIAWRLCVPFIVYVRRLCVAFMRGGMRRGLCGGVCRSPCLSLSCSPVPENGLHTRPDDASRRASRAEAHAP